MSCKITYNGVQYDSQEDLKIALLAEMTSNFQSLKTPVNTQMRDALPIEDTYDFDLDFEYDFDDDYVFDGDFFQDKDDAENKFKKLKKAFERNESYFDTMIQDLTQKIKTEKNPDRIKTLKRLLSQYELYKNNMMEARTSIDEFTSLGDFKQFAENQINYLTNIIKVIGANFENKDLDPTATPLSLVTFVNNSLRFWRAVGNVRDQQDHIVLSEAQLKDANYVNAMLEIDSKARAAEQKFTKLKSDIVIKLVGNTLNEDLTKERIEMILNYSQDISSAEKLLYDIGAYSDDLLSSILVLAKRANFKALEQIDQAIVEFDTLINQAGPKLKWDDFVQKYSDGQSTGRLVFKYSPEYQDAKAAARSSYYSLKSSENPSLKAEAYNKYTEWLKENEDILNILMLFPTSPTDDYHWPGSNMVFYTEEDKQAHITKMKENLGDEDFDLLMQRAKDNIDHFKAMWQFKKEEVSSLAPGLQKEVLDKWEKENSPYWLVWKLTSPTSANILTKDNKTVINNTYDQLMSVPKRFKEVDGEMISTGYYDTRYDKLQSDPDLKAVHDFMLRTTSLMYQIAPQKMRILGENGLPFIKQDILQMFMEGNSLAGLPKQLLDKLDEYTSTQDYGEIDYQERDPLTGKVRKKPISHLDVGQQRIRNHINQGMLKWSLENADANSLLTEEEVKELKVKEKARLKKEILTEIAKESSKDIGTVMKAYIMFTYMHHHKSNIQDALNLAAEVASERKKIIVNSDGTFAVDSDNELVTEGSTVEKIQALEYFIDSFYGHAFKNDQYVGKKKIYTEEDTKRKAELEALLEKNEQEKDTIGEKAYTANKKFIEAELKRLGRFRVGSKQADLALKYVQYKMLGWNVLANVGNIMFGYTANSIEAAKGRFFTEQDLQKARWVLKDSVGKNLSFNQIESPVAKKIRRIMDRLDILKDASSELYKAGNNSTINKKFRWLHPMQGNKRGEYLNQAQILVAYMLNEKNTLTGIDGQTYSLWEAYDENGKFRFELFEEVSDYFESDFKTRIEQIVKLVHGNYDELSPLMAKKFIEGRALLQFKTWFLEAWRSRFGKEEEDKILKIKMKGRYRTIKHLVWDDSNWKTNIGIFVKGFLKKYFDVTTFGLIKTNYGDMSSLSQVDAENMRANIFEFIVWLNLTGLALLFKYLNQDDDDENKVVYNLLLGQITRLSGDMELYANPKDLAKFTQNLMPLTSMMRDAAQIMDATVKTLNGNYYMEKGPFEGWLRLPKEMAEAVPITFAGTRLLAMTEKFKDDDIFNEIVEEE